MIVVKHNPKKESFWARYFFNEFGEKPEHEWLKPVAGAHLSTVRVTSRIVFYTIFVFFVIFVLWASFFEIDEYVHAQGKIEPESEIKKLSHFEGGIIDNIFVKEGDRVKKGQVLLTLKDISSKASYEESLHNYYQNWAQILRLRAQINDQPLVIPAAIQHYSTKIVSEARDRYNASMAAFHNEQKIINEQLIGTKSELVDLKVKINNQRRLYELSKERTELLSQLVSKQLLAKTQFIASKMDTAAKQMDLQNSIGMIDNLEGRIREAQDKLNHVKLRYNIQDWQELKDHESRLIEAKKLLQAGKDRVERGEIRSPVNGIVHELFNHTIGSAVTSGRELISVVPIKDSLIIEAMVLPQDIGFIREGDPATIKVSAYDYSIYGGLSGTVVRISPDTVQDPKDPQRSYFKVHIHTEKNTIEHHGKIYTIIPGQTVQADIITAKRTVMQYLLKPLVKTLSDPLRER